MNTHHTPTISVIMPCYNRAYCLDRALFSITQQSFLDSNVVLNKFIEVIVVDDGSTDDTFEVVNKYIQQHGYFHYIKHENRGQPLSMNAGIDQATGQYITFLDSDDEYLPTHLDVRYRHMVNNPQDDILHGGLEIIGNPFVPDKFDNKKMIHIDECIAGGTLFAKRKVFTDLAGFKNIPYSHDFDFIERAVETGFRIRQISAKTYKYYRDTEDGTCNTIQNNISKNRSANYY
jgi:glycosyltransferase involved in cell wall biosynthesis